MLVCSRCACYEQELEYGCNIYCPWFDVGAHDFRVFEYGRSDLVDAVVLCLKCGWEERDCKGVPCDGRRCGDWVELMDGFVPRER